jgi:hypothetical protein
VAGDDRDEMRRIELPTMMRIGSSLQGGLFRFGSMHEIAPAATA